MGNEVSLEGIAEVAIALVGFSGLLMMLRSGPVPQWHPRPRLAFWCTLTWALGALFFSYLPSTLEPLGITTPTLPNLLLGVFLSGAISGMLLVHSRLNRQGTRTQNAFLWVLMLCIAYPASLLVFASAAGLLEPPGFGWYRLGVIACLFASLLPFVSSFRLQVDEPPT